MTVDVDSIDLDDLPNMGSSIPNGTYDVKLIDIQAATTRAGDPILRATFEVLNGDQKGLTYQGGYFLGTYKTKEGKVRSIGVMNMKRDAMELGVVNKLPNPFPLDANKAKAAYHKAFKGLRMRLRLQDGQPSTKDGKIYKEFQLMPGVTSAPAPDAEDEEIVY